MHHLPNYLLFFALFCTAVHGFAQVDSGGLQEKHYQFLKKELQETRTFYTQEREAHRKFLESYYAYVSAAAGGLVLAFVGIITFLNWRNRNEFKAQLDQELALEAERLKMEGDKIIQKAKSNYEKELRNIFMKDLSDFERQKEALLTILREQIGAKDGRYLFIAAKEKLEQMKGAELNFLKDAFPNLQAKEAGSLKGFSFEEIDVLLYRSNVDDNGEDEYITKTLLPFLNSLSVKIPIVVYAKGRHEFLKGNTETALNNYLQYQLANNIGTLIDNTASSFRTYRLLKKNKALPKA